jgi:biopolymer transport protein ExbD
MDDDFSILARRDRFRPLADINVTSLVDVTLVLLIIFMLTAPFIQGGVEVELPEARTPASATDEGLVVSVDPEQRVFVDEDVVPLSQLAVELRRIRPAGSEGPVYLRSDQGVPYGFVVRVMGEIKEGGVDDLSLVVEPAGDDPGWPR